MLAAARILAAESRHQNGLHSAGTLAGTRPSSQLEHLHYANMAAPANWHDTPGEYFECTRKLTTTKSIKAQQHHSSHGYIRFNYYKRVEENNTLAISKWSAVVTIIETTLLLAIQLNLRFS